MRKSLDSGNLCKAHFIEMNYSLFVGLVEVKMKIFCVIVREDYGEGRKIETRHVEGTSTGL